MLNATFKMNKTNQIRAVSFLAGYISDISANPGNMMPGTKKKTTPHPCRSGNTITDRKALADTENENWRVKS